jgi:3-hydroxy-9,10-secoandrosta-1,3,5(10)-triene-9,17-dione monooxygenase reductase component
MSSETLRQVMRSYPQGVSVVTAQPPGEEPRGITVSSLLSVSLDPPLILVSIAKNARAHPAIEKAGAFAVNLLAEDQGPLSEHFAVSGLSSEEQFGSLRYRPSPSGAPLIEGCVAFLDCRVVDVSAYADHSFFIGEVEEGEVTREARPLVYYNRSYWALGSEVHRR